MVRMTTRAEPGRREGAPHIAQATVAGAAVDLLLVGALASGLDRAAIIADVGLPPEFLEPAPPSDRPRVPLPTMLRLWGDLATRTGREHFGLWLAQLLVGHHGETLGGHIVRSAPTLGEGIRRMLAVERVFHGVEVLSLEIDGETARLRHRAPLAQGSAMGSAMGQGAAPAADFGFAWILLVGRGTTGDPLRATSVRLVRERPADVGPWIEILGAEPEFGAGVDLIELHARALDLPQRSADDLVARLVERYAKALLEVVPDPSAHPDQGLIDAARAFVGRCVAESRPEDAVLASFAERERVAPRTLQRRLSALGTTFAAIADGARADLARHQLRSGASIAEVAVLLGFGDQAAFHKAFVRWEGVTPGAFLRAARRP
jgi:AraC-like DNA-binding protein